MVALYFIAFIIFNDRKIEKTEKKKMDMKIVGKTVEIEIDNYIEIYLHIKKYP